MTMILYGWYVQSRMELVNMRETITFVETLDKQKRLRRCI